MCAVEMIHCNRCSVGLAKQCEWNATSRMGLCATLYLCDECEECARGIIAVILPVISKPSFEADAGVCEKCGSEKDLDTMVWRVAGVKNSLVCAILCSDCAVAIINVVMVFAGRRSHFAPEYQFLMAEARKRFPIP